MRKTVRNWQGGEHAFLFDYGALRGLEDARDAGAYYTLQRLMSGLFRLDDVTDVIKFGLIGGGMGEGDARRLVTRVAGEVPLYALALFAASILGPFTLDNANDPAISSESSPGEHPGVSATPEAG